MTFLHPFLLQLQLAETLPTVIFTIFGLQGKKTVKRTKLSRSANGCTIAMPQQGDLKTKLSQGPFWAEKLGSDEVWHVGCDTDVISRNSCKNILLQI